MTASHDAAGDGVAGPLAGVRVLDLVEDAAAYGPKLLAGLGAEVIRVEPPGGALHRRRPPFYPVVDGADDGLSLYFCHYNAGKKGITLDLGSEAGRTLLRRLIDTVDVVFDNGELARFGIDPAALAARSPLVVVSVTPFGLQSARSHWLGSDLICQAMSGMIGLFGFRDERPARFGPEQASEMGGLAAVLGALIALYGARRHGSGDLVDVAIERVCALVTLQMSNASMYHQFGVNRTRGPRERGVQGVYEARDGFLTLNAFRPPRALIAMLQQAGAAEDLPELWGRLPEAEFIADPHVQEVVRRFVAERTRAEVIERAQAHGLLGLPINDVADLIADPFLQGRAFFVDVAHPELERSLTYTGAPVRFSRTPYRVGRRPPLLGEHNDEVLASAERGARNAEQDGAQRATPRSALRIPRSGDLPLAGVRLLDLSWIIAGPLTTRLLADFGAEVIKVESAGRMDVGRGNRIPLYGPLPGDANSNPDAGGYFQDVNAGKLSCTLNLAEPEGRDLLTRLVAVSDGIVCNLGGDQLDRWGIGYERARKINPGIIVVNMPTMESHGARARWRAFGDMLCGAAGMKSISGHPDDPPLPFGHQYADFSANPFHAAIALMAALHHRARTGEGQFIEVSQYESTVALMGASVLDYTANGRNSRRTGNRDPLAVPHNIYRCRPTLPGPSSASGPTLPDPPSPSRPNPPDPPSLKGRGETEPGEIRDRELPSPKGDGPARSGSDGGAESWCAVACFTEEQWQALSAIQGVEALRRPEWRTLEGRKRDEAEIDAIVEAWTSHWDPQELAAFLQERGVPAGPFQGLPEITGIDPVLGDNYFVRVQHPVGREFLVHGSPLQMRRQPPVVGRGPLLGEHTFSVLHDILGLSTDEIAAYAACGAIE